MLQEQFYQLQGFSHSVLVLTIKKICSSSVLVHEQEQDREHVRQHLACSFSPVFTVFGQFRIEPLFRFNSKKESKSDVLKLTVLMCVRMADADDFLPILLCL